MSKQVRVDVSKQYFFVLFLVVLIVVGIFSSILEEIEALSIIGIFLILLLFSDEVTRIAGIKKTKVFSEIKDGFLCIYPLGTFGRKKLIIKMDDVEGVTEWGRAGKRRFEIVLKDGNKLTLNLERLLGFSYSRNIEEEFYVFLKENFSEIVHAYR